VAMQPLEKFSLGKSMGLPFDIGDKLVGGEGLAIGQNGDAPHSVRRPLWSSRR
jgi:hypothetical protein